MHKNESIPPPRPGAPTTGAAIANVTGRTPEVPPGVAPDSEVTQRPVESQVGDAADVARELDRTPSWRDDFSALAPDRAVLTAQLLRAKALSDELARAEAWTAWLASERDRAWQQALATMGQLRPHFDAADASDPNVALRYPKTRTFFAARAAVALRGATTRRRNRAKKSDPAPT